MINKGILDFLKNLRKNNNSEWFHSNKDTYLKARGEFEILVSEVLAGLATFDKTLLHLEPKKCIFRINRDIRFSHDKSPYKTNFGAWFSRDGKNGSAAGYYLQLEPGACFIAGGVYMPASDILKSVRQEIYVYNDEFKKILAKPSLKKEIGTLWEEDKLKKAPKGFDPNFEDVDLLKYKHYILNKNLSDKDVTADKFPSYAIKTFQMMHPFVVFLNRGIDENKENR